MHSITFKGKTLSTEREVRRALDLCRSLSETREIMIKMAANMEIDARRRYEEEKDPYIKNQMKYFINSGNYDFDRLFGRE